MWATCNVYVQAWLQHPRRKGDSGACFSKCSAMFEWRRQVLTCYWADVASSSARDCCPSFWTSSCYQRIGWASLPGRSCKSPICYWNSKILSSFWFLSFFFSFLLVLDWVFFFQFAMGLNMPAKTVVFTAVKKWDGDSHRYIGSGEYIQVRDDIYFGWW